MPDREYQLRYAHRDIPTDLLDADRLLASGRVRTIKDHGRTTVACARGAYGAVAIKRFRDATPLRILEGLVLGSRARRVSEGAARLRAAGFVAPEILAVLERRRLGLPIGSCVIAEWVEGAPLDDLWRSRRGAARRALTIGFARYLRALHAAGIYPQDVRAANVLVTCESPPQFVLVDLDRVRRYRRVSWRRRRKNLAQVHRSVGRGAARHEAARFLRQYLGPVSHDELRRAVSEVLELAERKDAEYTRRRGGVPRPIVRRAADDGRPESTTADEPADERVGAMPAAPRLQAGTREPISCTIICYEEEDNIRAALESVRWCDEIVVVDSFSHDRTVEICRDYTDRIYQRPWPGFVEQKAFALEQARFPWVLNLDADERVSPELRCEIEEVLRAPQADGYYVPRLVYYLGRWWRRGGWYPDYRLRLFRRERVVWGGVDPHEKVILHGRSARLRGPLLHYTYRDISDHLATINAFTGVAARELLLRGRTTTRRDLLLRPLWRFFRFYVLRLGFTQGLAGLFVAQSAAFYVFSKYAKLWEATRGSRPSGRAARVVEVSAGAPSERRAPRPDASASR